MNLPELDIEECRKFYRDLDNFLDPYYDKFGIDATSYYMYHYLLFMLKGFGFSNCDIVKIINDNTKIILQAIHLIEENFQIDNDH